MASIQELEGDPQAWTLDQVIQQLCHNPHPPWSNALLLPLIPERQALEQIFRQNHVDGDTLLALDLAVLKEELAIHSLGQRRAIMKVVEYLRQHSQAYQQILIQSAALTNVQSQAVAYSTAQSISPAGFSRFAHSPTLNGLGYFPPLDVPATRSPSVASGTSYMGTALPLKSQTSTVHAGHAQPKQRGHQKTPSTEPVTARSSEQLNSHSGLLDMLQANLDAELSQIDHRIPTSNAPSTAPPENTTSLQPPKKEKRRIAPFSIPQKKEVMTENSYLSPDAKTLQDTFYHRLETDWAGDLYRLLEDDSTEFVMQARAYPTGRRRLISARLQHFLRQSVQTLPQSQSLARIPYTQEHSEASSVPYFTLFPHGTDRPRVCRLDDFPALAEAPGQPLDDSGKMVVTRGADKQDITTGPVLSEQPVHSFDDLDYLLEKYPAEDSDQGLPCYGDSGDEWELDDETWQEYQQEQAEKVLESTALTRLQVESIIDQTLEMYKREWHDDKLAKIQHKAYKMWLTAAKLKNRRGSLADAHFHRDRAMARLAKLREALAKDVWHNNNDVKHQCQSLELTVHSIEEQTYYIHALESNDPPLRPSKIRLELRPTKKLELVDEGEELLESESDIDMSQIDDDNFIDDDNLSDAPSIHHDLDTWSPKIPDAKQRQPILVPDHDIKEHASVQPPSIGTPPLNSNLNADDADDESDEDDIVTPSTARRHRGRHDTPPIKTPIGLDDIKNEPASISRKQIDMTVDSEADTSDVDLLPKLPQSSKRFEDHYSSRTVVDLTHSSPASAIEEANTDFDVHTPELNSDLASTPTRKQSRASTSSRISDLSASDSSSLNTQDFPSYEDINGILDLSWDAIEQADDHDRALAKAIYSLSPAPLERLRIFLKRLPPADDQQNTLLLNGFVAISDGQQLIEDVKPRDTEEARLVVSLYLSYHFSRDLLDTWMVSKAELNGAHSSLLEQGSMFYDLMSRHIQNAVDGTSNFKTERKVMKRKREQEFFSSEDEELLDDSDIHVTDNPDSDLQIAEPPSSHRKRKRAVVESQEAKSQRRSDRERIEEQEKRRKILEKFAMVKADGDSAKPVNFSEPIIYLDTSLARRIKPHQLRGVQFLWREIIEDPKHQGCILAHTMGLGKTMQVISLLVTIFQCNKSRNPAIVNHIPSHLRELQVLILCPATLLDNWEDELLMWSPGHEIGNIYKVSSSNKRPIEDWARTGGVLLLGYERFLRIIDSDIKSRPPHLKHGGFKKLLLDGPNLVIADEAHKMKNPKSKITQTAKGFRTRSRIALTGSPLNNHLEEYHTMVDWIAPNYLGKPVEFRAKYSEPIEAGLFADSSREDKRLSMRKLHVLKKELKAKIDRADISAIAQDMPAKTEYFITIPLTDLQQQAYNVYVKSMLETVGSIQARHRNTRLWDWIAVLQWLCNHPSCCITKLKQRQQKAIESAQNEDVATESEGQVENGATPGEALPDDVIIDPNGPMNAAIQKVVDVFEGVDAAGKLEDTKLSYRTLIVESIVKEAVSVGDKTLIFSHSLPTLNFLQNMLDRTGHRYCRLDGQTAVGKRQTMTKVFNQKDSFQVFLISMKAGGLGMNLQGANRVIIFDFSFNPSWEEQAVGRAYRLGQTRPVFVYRFRAGGTFEDNMFNKSMFKTQLFNRVVDQKNPLSHASKNISDWLFPVRDVEQQEFDECLGKDEKVLDKIIKRVDCIRNIQLTETFQREDEDTLDEQETLQAEADYHKEQLLRTNPKAYYEMQRTEHGPPGSTQPQYLHSHGAPAVRYLDREGPGMVANSGLPFPPIVNREFLDRVSGMVPAAGLPSSYQYIHQMLPLQAFDDTASRRPQTQIDIRRRGQSAGPE